ncbi:FkbM family methyltransferase [Candidatus Pelagibacter sp.]|nr:FkbM family methyltransferase [Candidatus Pelagibacter sp.]
MQNISKYIRLICYFFQKKINNFKNLELNNDSVVIDIGANIGIISQVIFDKYGSNVYCYEPNQYAYKKLIDRFKNNKKIYCFNNAIAENNDEKKMFYHKNVKYDQIKWSTGSSLLEQKRNVDSSNFSVVQTMSIEDLINKFDMIDLIKIDIEGYEYKILPTIIKNKKKIKKIICELHGNPITNKNKFLKKDYEKLVSNLKELKLYDSWFIEHY